MTTTPDTPVATPTPAPPAPTPEPPTPLCEINGLPCYLGVKGIVPEVIADGHHHFYVLAGHDFKWTGTDNKQRSTEYATLFRVTNTVLGTAISPADASSINMKEKATFQYHYSLPKIPFNLVTKMDTFFRLAHKRHSSEAILMLLYDTNYLTHEDPRLGWAAIAPKQENTAAECKYDPASIVDHLPENVILAGSAHSHPEMPAYASGTDHKDQAGWDGVHITYGWKTGVRGGATEYYHEVIYAGWTWSNISLEQVMELAPAADMDEESVTEWLDNVSKKTFAPAQQGGYAHGPKSQTSHQNSGSNTRSGVGVNVPTFSGTNILVPHRAVKYAAGSPDPKTHILIGLVSDLDNDPVCPHCFSPVDDLELNHLHRCYGCMQYIGSVTTPLERYNEDRMANKSKYILELDPAAATLPIMAFRRYRNDEGEEICDFTEDLRTMSEEEKKE